MRERRGGAAARPNRDCRVGGGGADADSHRRADTDRDILAHPDRHPNGRADCDTYTGPDPHTAARPNSHPDGLTHTEPHTEADA